MNSKLFQKLPAVGHIEPSELAKLKIISLKINTIIICLIFGQIRSFKII